MIKRAWDAISRSVERRLLFYLLLLSLPPIIIFASIIAFLQTNAIRELTEASMQTEAAMAFSELDDRFQEAVILCRSIENSAAFQRYMRRIYESREERYEAELDSNMELMAMAPQNSGFDGVYLLGNNGFSSKSNSCTMLGQGFTESAWYLRSVRSRNPVWFSLHKGSFVVKTGGRDMISCCYPFRDKSSNTNVGVIVVDIAEDSVSQKLDKRTMGRGAYLLLDEGNRIFYHSEDTGLSEGELSDAAALVQRNHSALRLNAPDPLTLKDRGLYAVAYRFDVTGWALVNAVESNYFRESAFPLLFVILFMFLLISGIATFTARMISRHFTEPVIEVEQAMKAVEEGDLSIQIEARGQDEMAGLAAGFNEMVNRVNALMNSVYENQRGMRRLELKALQEQINPHFLYNALDSIKWLLRLQRTEDAVDMLKNLSLLFRIYLSHGHEIITVREELKHVRAYLELQAMEYKSKFSYAIESEEDVLDYLVPKILLQPLVENSLKHGISISSPSILITVRAKREGENIILSVEDNGAGIPREALDILREKVKNAEQERVVDAGSLEDSGSGGYGLKNVSDRVKLNFGMEYGIRLFSDCPGGTRVDIVIPKRLEMTER